MLPASVIIPTYNRWPMIGEAIESVLCQSFKYFELIVVDDGSTDETVEEILKFGSRVILLTQPRRGVAAARNFGVRRSSGRYLSFLDSDDLWKP
ncbi:MAG: glycosyltransferase, partial [Deltaproteobacteria bacterium]|nr:glycosyltransferase [Deltaproteobacteria bacterium]